MTDRDIILRIDEELESILELTVYYDDDFNPRIVVASAAACRILLRELVERIRDED